jgi:transcriptional regulator with XRE-family HTH domain
MNAGIIVALAFMVGTGGLADARYLQKRQERGYGLAAIRSGAEAPVFARTPAQDLERIRTVLNPTVSALANLFGVSRQAIYNWSNGEVPREEYAARLGDLAEAADIIATEGLSNPSMALKRKLAGGKTLLEIAAHGGSAADAARQLSTVLRREAEQHRALEARLSGRPRTRTNVDDFGTPMLDENG